MILKTNFPQSNKSVFSTFAVNTKITEWKIICLQSNRNRKQERTGYTGCVQSGAHYSE